MTIYGGNRCLLASRGATAYQGTRYVALGQNTSARAAHVAENTLLIYQQALQDPLQTRIFFLSAS